MKLSYDPAKSERNRVERGLPFRTAYEFDWAKAIIVQDRRRDYHEERFRATSLLGGELHMLVFSPTYEGVRVISLRRASRKERRQWHASRTPT